MKKRNKKVTESFLQRLSGHLLRSALLFSVTGCNLIIHAVDNIDPKLTDLVMVSPAKASISPISTATLASQKGIPSYESGGNITFYLNDPQCGSPSRVGSASSGSSFTLTSGSLLAGGEGLKSLYYKVEYPSGKKSPCWDSGLHYTYQVPKIKFTRMGYTIKEASAGYLGPAVTLERDLCGVTTTLNVTASEVTALSGVNFTGGSIPITFTPAECGASGRKTIPASAFSVLDDSATTGDLFFKAVISNVSGGAVDTSSQTAQINILDSAFTQEYAFNQPLYTVDSRQNTATLTVQRAGNTGATASVDVVFVDGSAVGTTDYVSNPQTVSFAIGEDEKNIVVPIFPHSYNASFIAKLVNPSAGTKIRNLSVAKVRLMGESGTCNPSGVPFGGGSGTSDSPYQICNLSQLKLVAINLTSTFKLMTDLASDGTLSPLGTLTGNFDGNEHIIFNFTFNGNTSKVGLFNAANTGSYIKGLNLLNMSVINTNTYTGGLLGYLSGSVMQELSNNLVSGFVSSNSNFSGLLCGAIQQTGSGDPVANVMKSLSFGLVKTSGSWAAGAVGYLTANAGANTNTFNFSSVYNAASVLSTNGIGGVFGYGQGRGTRTYNDLENRGYLNGATSVGGIIGFDQPTTSATTNLSFSNSTNYGTIVGAANAAGVLGQLTGYQTATLNNLVNYGPITSTGTQTGGVAGYISGSSADNSYLISNSKNYGMVTGVDAVAGILGKAYSSGAITGVSFSISNSGNYAAINGGRYVAGIGGMLQFATTGAAPTNNTISVTGSTNSGSITSTDTGAAGGAMSGGILGYFTVPNASEVALTFDGNSSTTGAISCPNGPNCGGLIGRIGFDGTKTGTISNSFSSSPVTGAGNMGGIIGQAAQTVGATTLNISGCYSTATVTSTANSAGGLIGSVSNTTGSFSVSRSYHTTGAVNATGSYSGGLVGQYVLTSGASNLIQRSYANAAISGNQNAGGLIGQIVMNASVNTITLSDSYSSGTVYATTGGAGGIAGSHSDAGAGYCTTNYTRLYTTSLVTVGSGTVGGLYASTTNCTANKTNTYWLKDTGLNAGLTSDTFQRPVYDLQNLVGQGTATYTGWDFTTIWNAFTPGSYPTLR